MELATVRKVSLDLTAHSQCQWRLMPVALLKLCLPNLKKENQINLSLW